MCTFSCCRHSKHPFAETFTARPGPSERGEPTWRSLVGLPVAGHCGSERLRTRRDRAGGLGTGASLSFCLFPTPAGARLGKGRTGVGDTGSKGKGRQRGEVGARREERVEERNRAKERRGRGREGGAGKDPGSSAAGPRRGEKGRWGRKSRRQKFSEPGGSRLPPAGHRLEGAWGPRDTHIMLVGHPPLLHVQYLHLHDAAPRRHGRSSAGPSARAGGAGCRGRADADREPGAERDPEPGPSTSRCSRRRPSLRAPSGPAAAAAARLRPAPGPPPAPPARPP